MLLLGLSAGHKIGLSIVAGVFIAFALISSFVIPRRKPDFPGKAGMSTFIIVAILFFAMMIAAVEIFGAE